MQKGMAASSNGKTTREIDEEMAPPTVSGSFDADDQIVLGISTSRKMLLDGKRQNKFFAKLKSTLSGRSRFKKVRQSTRFSSPSSSVKFGHTSLERDGFLNSISSPGVRSSPRRFLVPFVKTSNWSSMLELFKKWVRKPMNMALLLWMTCVFISGSLLFLVMTGMLNGALATKSERDTWFEVNNQILNALFTLMCLYQHPKRFHHLVLLCRWRHEDTARLRKIYCKNGTQKPSERKHILVVVLLLHVNCFAQYALCGLNLGYARSQRPAFGVGLCLSVAIGAPAIASLYSIASPLGKEYNPVKDDGSSQGSDTSTANGGPSDLPLRSPERRYQHIATEDHRMVETSPQWAGGLLDLWDDISLAYLSVFCSCCIFGWNMDRLGFGNMYVHIATFLLFCLAPFFIFNLAAVNIDNETVRAALGITGFLLCIFGLLYGGFWRIQMRKKFNLPPNTFCCGEASVTDCFQWLFCCSCSLAQEVRTADYYDVVNDKFYVKEVTESIQPALFSLPRESRNSLLKSSSDPFNDESDEFLIRMETSASPIRSSGVFTSEEHKCKGTEKRASTLFIPKILRFILESTSKDKRYFGLRFLRNMNSRMFQS